MPKAKPRSTKPAKVTPLLVPGQIVLIRTAVYHALGRVAGIHQIGSVDFVQLHDAAFIGDTGRYHKATSVLLSEIPEAEIEPVSDGVLDIQVAIICDVARAVGVVGAVK